MLPTESFFSSARGPGLMSLLIAGLFVMSVSANDSNEEGLIERDQVGVPSGELASLRSELDVVRMQLDELRRERDSLRAELGEFRTQASDWERMTRERRRRAAVGERLDSLRSGDGRILTDVQILAVTGAGIEVRHSTGTARLQCHQLPREWWARFGWSNDEQRQVIEAERRQEAILRSQVAAARDAAELRAEREEQELERRREAARRAATALAKANVRTSPLHEPPRSVGRPWRSRCGYGSNGYYGRGFVRYYPVCRPSFQPSRASVSSCSRPVARPCVPIR
jgi:hypothetical protein